MKEQRKAGNGAFSLPELLLVLGIIAILGALLIPTLTNAKRNAAHTQCLRNMHEIGIEFQSFAHDHNNLYPTQVAAQSGGSLEYCLLATNGTGGFYYTYRLFLPIAKDLKSLKTLICPADNRVECPSPSALGNANISYFIAPTAKHSKPDSILLGDRNLVCKQAGLTSSIVLSPQNVEWNAELHNHCGNLLFGDGHARNFDNAQLPKVLKQASGTLILPPVLPEDDAGTLDGSNIDKPSNTFCVRCCAR
jgi:prepilin-type N-terminal cleavage/methylation domain-containing protein